MSIKNYWVKMINSMVLNYKVLENFLCLEKYEILIELSKSSFKIINILIKNQIKFGKKSEIFLTGNIVILKHGISLIFLRGFIFKLQNFHFRLKKNLVKILEKYLTTLNIYILNNYFKVSLMFVK